LIQVEALEVLLKKEADRTNSHSPLEISFEKWNWIGIMNW